MELIARRMKPEAAAIVRNGNVRVAVHQQAIVKFRIVAQLTHVNVQVALGAALVAVECQAPMVAEQFPGFGNGGGPKGQALFGRHLREGMRMRPGESQPSIWLARINVFQEEDRRIPWQLFGFPAQAAFVLPHALSVGKIAGAVAHVGERQGGEQQKRGQGSHMFII